VRTRSEYRKHARAEHVCQGCGKGFEGLANPAPKRCAACRYIGRRWALDRIKYRWTPERDEILRERYDSRKRGRAQEIADGFGWPKWAVTRRATALGLSYTKPANWTPDEVGFLWEHAGSRTIDWMAKRLSGRSKTAIVLALKHRGISRRWREGYTLRELELCFGCDHHGIRRWIHEGKLNGNRRGTNRTGPGGRSTEGGNAPADAWYFTDEDLLRFIKAHPMAFELRKVDQFWFMDLITSGGLVRRALADQRETDEDLEDDAGDSPPRQVRESP